MIYLIIIILALVLFASFDKGREKQGRSAVDDSAPKRNERRNRLYSREARRERHGKVWAVLFLLKAVENLERCGSFYDFEKSIENFNKAKRQIEEERFAPSPEHINTAIRYIRYHCYIGDCKRGLHIEETESIYDWRTIDFCKETTFEQVADTFESYWDDVLIKYKQQSARSKRRLYLVNHIKERKSMDVYKDIPNAMPIFDKLILHYS